MVDTSQCHGDAFTTSKPHRTISTRPAAVSTLLYLPGDQLITGLEDGSLQITNLTTDDQTHGPYYTASRLSWLTKFFGIDLFRRCYLDFLWGPTVAIDHKTIVTGGWCGTLRVFDTEEKEYIGEARSKHRDIRSIAISPDHEVLGTSHKGAIVVWKLSKRSRKRMWSVKTKYLLKVRCSIRTNQPATCLALSPDGKRLAAGYADGSIHVFDTDTGHRIPLLIEGHAHTISSLLWSRDGSLLISGAHDHTIQRWSSRTGRSAGHFPAGRARIIHLALSPDGKKLASASYDGTVTFWDMATCLPLEKRLFHTRTVWTLAFSPSGEFVVCGQDDGEVSIWRVPWAERKNDEAIILDDASVHSSTHAEGPVFLDATQGSSDLTDRISRDGDYLEASGTYACVYRGLLHGYKNPIKVAIKVIKVGGAGLERKEKRLLLEIKILSSLSHPNILPFLGTARGFGQLPAIISPWADHGTLTSYLENGHEYFSVIDILTLLSDVASALRYLHSCWVVHGDLSGSNILILADKRACIADFGLSMSLSEGTYASSFPGGTLRWMAPELLDPQVPEDGMDVPKLAPTHQSDIYSFGGIMLQILSGRVPYHHLPRDGQVIKAIAEGKTPSRPDHYLVTDRRWSLIQRCWASVGSRPPSVEIAYFTEMELVENLTSR